MLFGGIPALWYYSNQQYITGSSEMQEVVQTIAFVTYGSTISFLLSLPWSAYYTFKVEQKHGFNKQVG